MFQHHEAFDGRTIGLAVGASLLLHLLLFAGISAVRIPVPTDHLLGQAHADASVSVMVDAVAELEAVPAR